MSDQNTTGGTSGSMEYSGSNSEVVEKVKFPGALDDNRPLNLRVKDYQAEEIAAGTMPVWREKSLEELPRYPVRDQNGRSSCVAESAALMLGVDNVREEGRFVQFSSVDLYSRRVNKPGQGMIAYNIMDLVKNEGATLELFAPSGPEVSEQTANAFIRKESDKQVAQVFKSGGYVEVRPDIEFIASIMEQFRKDGVAKPIMTWYRFNFSEWNAEPQSNNTEQNIHHSVVALDYFLYRGRKALWTQDSWGLHSTTNGGYRIIYADFLNQHMTYAGAFADLSNAWRDGIPPVPKPRYNFTRTLRLGETSTDVSKLQDILRYEGLFPTEIPSSGKYLQITAKSVMAFQRKHKVASEAEIVALKGETVGPKTISKLNELYA